MAALLRALSLLMLASLLCSAAAQVGASPNVLLVNNLLPQHAKGLRVDAAALANTTIPPLRFSWALTADDGAVGILQLSARVQLCMRDVAGCTLVWDSGAVSGAQQSMLFSGSSPLREHSVFAWTVSVTSHAALINGTAVTRSATASFVTGVDGTPSTAWRNATMLVATTCASFTRNRVRRTFALPATPIVSAVVSIAAPGYVEAFVNGVQLGSNWMYCRPQDDIAWCTHTRDVDVSTLTPGNNTLGLFMGFYGFAPMQFAVRLTVRFTDGSVMEVRSTSDGSWHVGPSSFAPGGSNRQTTYDVAYERTQVGWSTPAFDENDGGNAQCGWSSTSQRTMPSNLSYVPTFSPARAMEFFTPVSISNPAPGRYVWNLSQNMAGMCAINIPAGGAAANGSMLEFTFGERIFADNGSVWQLYHFPFQMWSNLSVVLDTQAVVVNTSLLFFVFQHVQVDGWPDALGAPALDALTCYLYVSDTPRRGEFTSSNALLNAIDVSQRYTILNSQQDMPLSDPERDNVNWLGDAHLAAEAAMHYSHAPQLYAHTLDVIQASQVHCWQTAPNGTNPGVPFIVPWTQPCQQFVPNGVYAIGGLEWSIAYVLFTDYIALLYNDTSIIATFYDSLVAYQAAYADIVPGPLYNFSVWGDWANVATGNTLDVCTCGYFPDEQVFINTSKPCNCGGTMYPNKMGGAWYTSYYWVYLLDALARYAGLLGLPAQQAQWEAATMAAASAFTSDYVNVNASSGNWYVGDASQAAAAFALHLPRRDAVMSAEQLVGLCSFLVDDVMNVHDGHLTTGMLGTKHLFNVLSDTCGAPDVAYSAATQTTIPSWGYTLAQGMTTVAEEWDEAGVPSQTMGALNHPMFATAADYFFKSLAGLHVDQVAAAAPWSQASTSIGSFEVTPALPSLLQSAGAAVNTSRGLLACSWMQNISDYAGLPLTMNVTVPVSLSALLRMPFARVPSSSLMNITVTATLLPAGQPAVVWADGSYHPAPGVLGVTPASLPVLSSATGSALNVTLVAGTWSLTASVA